MKKLLVLLLTIVTVFAFCIPAFADEAEEAAADPVQGSWILYEVYDMSDAENPVSMDPTENQSLYGSDLTVFTFFEEGYAVDTTFTAVDMFDVSATWTLTAENEYEFAEEDGITETFIYDPEADSLKRTFENYDFIYARAFVGTWQLAEVVQINEGDAPTELPKEENQSLYGNADNILVFAIDGESLEIVFDGTEGTEVKGSWEMTSPDVYVNTEDGIATEYNYFRVDDTLYYDIVEQGEEGRTLRFTYARTKAPEDEEEAFPADAELSLEDELIAGGQIFTGVEQTLYDPETGEPVVVKELNQGGWANDATGVIYEQGEGGEGRFYGNDGSILVTEWELNNN